MENIVALIVDGKPDSTGDIIDPSGIRFADFIPVTLGFQPDAEIVDEARLKREDDRILADVEMLKSIGLELYPAIGGMILKRDIENGTITECIINQISISAARNVDDRIEKVKF